MCKIEDFEWMGLDNLHPFYNRTLGETLEQELALYHRCYLPVGKMPLDVGAGIGEVANFYLYHGAERVICIEGNSECCKVFRRIWKDDPRVTLIEAHIDSGMIDIEGSEKGFLIEIHFPSKLKPIWKPAFAPNVTLFRLEEKRISLPRLRGQPT